MRKSLNITEFDSSVTKTVPSQQITTVNERWNGIPNVAHLKTFKRLAAHFKDFGSLTQIKLRNKTANKLLLYYPGGPKLRVIMVGEIKYNVV